MWTWVIHRVTGVLIFFFLFVHVLDTALVRVSPEAYNAVMESYKNPIVGLLETALVGAIMFHAVNGVRVALVDLWSKGVRLQKPMFRYGVTIFWLLFMIPFVVRHLGHVFGGE